MIELQKVQKVIDFLRTQPEGARVGKIREATGLSRVEGNEYTQSLKNRGFLRKIGLVSSHKCLWVCTSKCPTTLTIEHFKKKYPNRKYHTQKITASTAKLQKPIMVELPRAVLKMLVKDVMQNNPNPTLEMQRAINCAVEKLL